MVASSSIGDYSSARSARIPMTLEPEDFFSRATEWVHRTPELKSTILFGSSARPRDDKTSACSDFDLHVVANHPREIERVNWEREMPKAGYCFQIVRPATGGVRKVTAVFHNGQLDVVVVPERALRCVRLLMRLGVHRKNQRLEMALNELATCLHSGYRFIKGERDWGEFFSRVAAEMPGVRLADAELRTLAEVFLCDLLWVLQKVERGELIAAQHVLHRQLSETNLRLARELRLRRGQPLPSFGLGRRVEALFPADEVARLRVESSVECDSLRRAGIQCLEGMRSLMHELVPAWSLPAGMEILLQRHGSHTALTPAR